MLDDALRVGGELLWVLAPLPIGIVGGLLAMAYLQGRRNVALTSYEDRVWAAKERSKDLLESVLDTGQRRELKHLGYVTVAGSAGGTFRVDTSGVFEYKNGSKHRYWCAIQGPRTDSGWKSYYHLPPEEMVPKYDVMAAKVLMIKYDEARFRRIAVGTMVYP